MAAIELTFIVLSLILLVYLFFAAFAKKRVPLVVELLYACVYLISTLFFFFPRTWLWLDVKFGVQLALDLILVLFVFGLFAVCVRLYQKIESLRQEITTLARQVAINEEVLSKSKSKK